MFLMEVWGVWEPCLESCCARKLHGSAGVLLCFMGRSPLGLLLPN